MLTVIFELEGQRFMGLNGGPLFKFSEAISMMVACDTQDEIDAFWEKLPPAAKKAAAAGSRTSSACRGR